MNILPKPILVDLAQFAKYMSEVDLKPTEEVDWPLHAVFTRLKQRIITLHGMPKYMKPSGLTRKTASELAWTIGEALTTLAFKKMEAEYAMYKLTKGVNWHTVAYAKELVDLGWDIKEQSLRCL